MKLPKWKLFFNSIKNYYFWVNDFCACSFCGQEIQSKEQLLLKEYWGRNYFDFDLACMHCLNKVKKHKKVKAKFIQRKIVIFLNTILQLPEGSIMVVLQPPDFVEGRYHDCFEAANINEPGVKIENKCQHSFNPNRNIDSEALEYKEKVERRIEFLDHSKDVITDKEAFGLLDSLQKAQPLLPKRKEIKHLEVLK